MSGPMLQIEGLVRHFDGVCAVDDVSLSVERGTSNAWQMRRRS